MNRHLDDIQHLRYQAFIIEAEAEKGIDTALAWAEKELGMNAKGNPDISVLRYGLFTVEDARRVCAIAGGAPFAGEHKVLIISASRAYHEAQNALLKLFEEPPFGTYLFFVLPSLGGLLPTLRSRVQVLDTTYGFTKPVIAESAKQFLSANKEKRSAMIKKLTSGKDDEERRALRDEAIEIINGVEIAAYAAMKRDDSKAVVALLSDIAILREHLYDRSAPVRMILEHLSLVIPKDLI